MRPAKVRRTQSVRKQTERTCCTTSECTAAWLKCMSGNRRRWLMTQSGLSTRPKDAGTIGLWRSLLAPEDPESCDVCGNVWPWRLYSSDATAVRSSMRVKERNRPARWMLSQATSVDAWQEPLWHAFVAVAGGYLVLGAMSSWRRSHVRNLYKIKRIKGWEHVKGSRQWNWV